MNFIYTKKIKMLKSLKALLEQFAWLDQNGFDVLTHKILIDKSHIKVFLAHTDWEHMDSEVKLKIWKKKKKKALKTKPNWKKEMLALKLLYCKMLDWHLTIFTEKIKHSHWDFQSLTASTALPQSNHFW